MLNFVILNLFPINHKKIKFLKYALNSFNLNKNKNLTIFNNKYKKDNNGKLKMEKKEINDCICSSCCTNSYNNIDEETIINNTSRKAPKKSYYKHNYNSNNMSISNNLTNLTNLTNDFEEKNNDLNIYYFGRSGKKIQMKNY